jgi:outer membrane biosynthesis protein TonB
MQRGSDENIMRGLDPKKSAGLKLRAEVSPDPFLRVYLNGEFVRSHRVKPGITVVGRDPGVDVVLADTGVSRRHFQIEYAGENRVYLQDLKSQNGTRLNGDPAVRARLENGDRITLGQHELVISVPTPAKEPKVIPFPGIKTEPGLPVRKPAIPKEEPTQVPTRGRPLRSLGLVLLTVTVAALLAWVVWQWTAGRPSVAPVPVVQPVVPKPAEIATLPPAEPSPKEEVTVASPRVKEEKTPKVFSRSLDKSLSGIGDQDLGAADRLVASAPSRSNDAGREARAMKGATRESVSVEITLPKLEERGAVKTEGKSKSPRVYDPAKYRTMLTSKVGSVESCYLAHAPSGGEAGKISVWLTIAASGQIRKSGIDKSTIANQPLKDCIVDQMLKTKVDPPPWDGFTVTYTFRFGSQKVSF